MKIPTTLFDLVKHGLRSHKVHMVYLGTKYEGRLTNYGQIMFHNYAFDTPSAFSSYVKSIGQSKKKKKTNYTLSASGWTDVYYGDKTLDEIRQGLKLPKSKLKEKKAFKQIKKLVFGDSSLKIKRGKWSLNRINQKITNLMEEIRGIKILMRCSNIPKVKVYLKPNLRNLSLLEENHLEMHVSALVKDRMKKNKQISMLKKSLKKYNKKYKSLKFSV